MRKTAAPTVAAFGVVVGAIFSKYAEGVVPVEFLWRPILVAAGLSAIIGVISLPARRFAVPFAITVAGCIVAPSIPMLAVAAIAGVLATAGRVWDFRTDGALLALAGTVGLVSVTGALPLILDEPTTSSATAREGPPTYVILLDGYPRADTLAAKGLSVDDFVGFLASRGFTYHPEARTAQTSTFRSLSALLVGHVEGDGPITNEEKRRHRGMWRLPEGWVAVAPPIGHVTIPNAPTVGGHALTSFEMALLGSSLLGDHAGGWVMDALRKELDDGLDTLEGAHYPRVFAHLLAPHAPYLYGADGSEMPAPACWPYCQLFESSWDKAGMVGTLAYLNQRLERVVDAVLDRYPDARMVLLSDHGGRFDGPAEAHRIFLATRGLSLESPTLVGVGSALFHES